MPRVRKFRLRESLCVLHFIFFVENSGSHIYNGATPARMGGPPPPFPRVLTVESCGLRLDEAKRGVEQ
jgi:hypothetical protein